LHKIINYFKQKNSKNLFKKIKFTEVIAKKALVIILSHSFIYNNNTTVEGVIMNTSKFLALSLLLVSSVALARVKFNTYMEFNNVSNIPNGNLTTQVELDANVLTEIYSADDMRIDAELLEEKDETATICYTIYAKNETGDFEKISAPVLSAAYGQEANLALGSAEGASINIVANATKI
jgi:hypothetical protein